MRTFLRSTILSASALAVCWGLPGCSTGTDGDTSKMAGAMDKMDTGKMAGAMDKTDTGKMDPGKMEKDRME
jgi:hypothetical protein